MLTQFRDFNVPWSVHESIPDEEKVDSNLFFFTDWQREGSRGNRENSQGSRC
jgi:hypothetical protein